MGKFMDSIHLIGGLPPNADAFDGTVNTDIFECLGEGAWFLIFAGTSSGGASVVTVQACDDITPNNTTAVAFKYRACTTFDTWGDWTTAATTGFTTDTSSDYMYEIWCEADELAAAGYGYVRLHMVESTNQVVDGCVLAGVGNPRYREAPESLID